MTHRSNRTYHINGNFAHLGGNNGCGCNEDNCHIDPIQSHYIIYDGANLPCTGINTCNDLTLSLQKIDAAICDLYNVYNSLTTTTTITP